MNLLVTLRKKGDGLRPIGMGDLIPTIAKKLANELLTAACQTRFRRNAQFLNGRTAARRLQRASERPMALDGRWSRAT